MTTQLSTYPVAQHEQPHNEALDACGKKKNVFGIIDRIVDQHV